jgi:signal transduction histidine kinase
MARGLSLANKSQLLFGFAVVLILAAALAVPWIRFEHVVENSQVEVARKLADAWLADRIQLGTIERIGAMPVRINELFKDPDQPATLHMSLVHVDTISPDDEEMPFIRAALETFRADASVAEHSGVSEHNGQTVYRYARAIRESQMRAIRDRSVSSFTLGAFDPAVADPLRAILVVDSTSEFAKSDLFNSRIFIIAAWTVGCLLAILVFYLILTKFIFSPVRVLRETAEKVEKGDLSVRSAIRTGDEFEQLSDAFNAMLDRLQQGQERLRQINEGLDLKVDELAQANVGLFESNRFKSEFLANVSHELRTPLNSIIGFAELLDELARNDPNADPKRLRYLANILTSGRSLLEMINELLDMAKIEAGRMEVVIEPVSVTDLIEGLANIMRPQADAKQIVLTTDISRQLPTIETDPGKLQQILFNFVSNAIKFTPKGGRVTISADRLTRQDNSLGARISVSDTGPGIPVDMQEIIFEKFRQIDASHTREHAGTGLGLAICRELAQMLGAEVSFVSEPGEGATFFVDLPQVHQPEKPVPLMA